MLLLLLLIGGGSSAWGETKDDVLTSSSFTATKNSYEFFSNVNGVSGAIYAGNSAKSNAGGIQLRSKSSNSGIVTTTTGGLVKSISVVVESGANALDVYGSHTPYTSAADLYKKDKQGTKLGSLSKTGEITLDGSYEYVGLRSSGGALYLTSITIKWETGVAKVLKSIAVSGTPTKKTYFDGEAFDPTGLVVTGTYDDGTQKEITDGIVWVKDPEILKLGTTSVDVKASVGNITSNIYTVEGITVKEKVTLVSIGAKGTPAEFWKGDKFNHDGITVTAHWSDESESDVTEQCQFTEPDMNTAGTKTVTVTYENKTCTYDIEVKTIENTKETAYTVSEAKKWIDAGKDLATQVYVKGIVSKIVTPFDSEYGNVSFDVSVDGSISGQQFRFYRTQKDAENKFKEDPNIEVGATVIGCGTLDKYNDIYEFKTGNYLVDYKAPVEKVLKSIAISGEATKTTYTEGETFDPAGLVVTATYDDESTEDVTGRVEWTFNPETLAIGTTSVSVTAKYQNVESAPFNVGVAVSSVDAVDCETVDFTEVYSHVKGNGSEEVKSYQGASFSMEFAKPQSSKTPTKYYANGTAVRAYTGNTITITAVQNIRCVLINYVKSYGDDEVEIKGLGTKNVVVTSSKTNRFTSITVYYKGVDFRAKSGENYYATFCCDRDVEFLDAEVFTVNVGNSAIALNEIANKQVPANTGVLLRSTKESEVFTYIESAPAIEGTNLLKPASEKMTEGFKYYKLAYDNYTEKTGLGFYWGAEEGGAFTVKPGLAYLAVPQAQAANVKGFSFDGTQTGINGVEATTAKGAIYNLNGQRVEKAQRGIYIQNGKKFIVK